MTTITKDVAFRVFGGELCCRCLCLITPENDAELPNASWDTDYNHKICNSCVEETDYDWTDERMCEIRDKIEPFRMEYEKVWNVDVCECDKKKEECKMRCMYLGQGEVDGY